MSDAIDNTRCVQLLITHAAHAHICVFTARTFMCTQVDLSGVKAGDKLGADYLVLPEGVQLYNTKKPFKHGRILGSVVGKLILLLLLHIVECAAHVRMHIGAGGH